MAVNIEREEQFVEILQESASKLVVVDFYSTTCPPCLIVDSILAQLVNQYPTVSFYKVDVQRFGEVSAQCRITATPTVQFFRKGCSVGEVRGADKNKIISTIEAQLNEASAATGAFGVTGHSDVTRLVLKKQSECLNQNDDHPLDNIFKEGTDSRLESDVDEQLVLHVTFSQPIKLHSLMLMAEPLDNAPRTIKIFVNRTDIDFDDAETETATQELEMTRETYEEKKGVANLRYVRFQNVNSLSIFVKDNLDDDDVSVISQLAFIGTPVDATANVSAIRQDEEEQQ